jgi:SAM-dependent methyltransferase
METEKQAALESDIGETPSPVDAPCVVCGSTAHSTACSAREVIAHHRYLRRFHKERLHLDSHADVAESALQDRINFTQDYATDIVSCSSCGLIYRNPRPKKETVLTNYATDEYDDEFLATAFRTQLDLFRSKARTVAKLMPQRDHVRMLEVGSFVGSFLAVGRDFGWDMIGVDPGEQAVAFSRARGLSVYRGTLPDLRLAAQSVDCVAIWNTFDQLPDPRTTLRIAQDILRPGGLLCLRIPNGDCFVAALKRIRRRPRWISRWTRAALAWNNLLMFPYLFGYSVHTADLLLGQYGLHRIAAHPDTLVTLADPHVKTWARLEERLVKLVCRAVARFGSHDARTAYRLAPWLDLYYVRTR